MIRCFAFLTVSLSLAATSQAAIVYSVSFDPTGSNLNLAANLSLGSSQSFGIYLHEIFDAGDTPRLDLAGGVNGLTTGNFRTSRSGSGGSAITGLAGNTAFDLGPTVVFSPSSGTVAQEILINSPVFGTGAAVGPGIRTAQLGSLTVTASGVAGDVNLFTLGDFNPGVGVNDLVIDNGLGGLNFVIDTATLSFGSLSVSAVPEPSSIILVSLLSGLGVLRLRRKSSRTLSA